jgi:ATP adenylyltransferase
MEYFFNFEKLGYLKGKKPDGCILCLVRDGSEDVESLIVYQSELSMVSLNLYPYNPGHLLLFPKRHVVDIRDLSDMERADLDILSRRCLDILDRTHGPSGYNLGYNMGLVAGASIEHLHMHVVPRYPREIGFAELIAGKRVIVQDPLETRSILSAAFKEALGVPGTS